MAKTFGFDSTTEDVLEGVNLAGKRAFITGVSAGLGVETARALAAHGAEITGAARDLAKARSALAAAGVDLKRVDLVELDLASLASARKCADALNAAGKKFDFVINNAGVMACPFGKTADGFETQFGTNHLGHFVLTNRITPLVKDGGRVVALSSGAHRYSGVDLEDPNFERTPYKEFIAYGRSKSANALFAVALDQRLRGRGIRAASVHPGVIPTELGRFVTPEIREQMRVGGAPVRLQPKTLQQGAATSVWAAAVAAGDDVGGRYCENCGVASTTTDAASAGGVRPYAQDPAIAEALWAKSEAMVGERFTYV